MTPGFGEFEDDFLRACRWYRDGTVLRFLFFAAWGVIVTSFRDYSGVLNSTSGMESSSLSSLPI